MLSSALLLQGRVSTARLRMVILHINKEGSLIKFVNKVQQISYNGKMAREKHQKMHYITERAVFELRPEGLVLTEIAPGIDLQTQILSDGVQTNHQ